MALLRFGSGLLAGAALVALGCSNSPGGVHVNRDLESSTSDLGTSSNQDGGNNNDECALPYAAVLIASNNGSGNQHGRVERVPLDGRSKCKPLTLGNSLPADADAVAFVPPNRIAVGALSGVYQIGLNDKAAAGLYKPATFAYTSLVDDLFPIHDESGKTLLAIAYDESNLHGSKSIEYLVTVDGDQEISRWEVASQGDIRIGFEPTAMNPSPRDPKRIFAVKSLSDGYAAGEFELPWDDMPREVEDPIYQMNLGSGGNPYTIKTLRQNQSGATLRRTVWTFRPNGAATGYQVYMVNQLDEGSKQLFGPYVCNLPACSTDAGDPYVDAIPDFTDDTAVVAICTDPGSGPLTRHVVRIRDNGSCEMLLDGSDLLAQEFPQRIATVYVEP